MKKNMMIGIVSLAALVGTARAQSDDAATQQHEMIGATQTDAAVGLQDDSVRQWFPEAGLGLFIHWGISSVDGGHDLSWGMMANVPWGGPKALTPETYWKLAEKFKPQAYNPEKWLRAAKEAGFGYAVLTTRHHDGFALWPSAYGDFNTRPHLDGRDLVGEYVAACRKVGMKVGFYYSPPDWHFRREYMSFGYGTKGTAESPHLGLRHEQVELPKKPADFDDRYIAYINNQITELMTRYGNIDLLWFDGNAGSKMLSQEKIRAMQPGILINDRGHGKGDFRTGFECRLPTERPEGCWEHCYGLTSCWGYRTGDEKRDSHRLAANLLVPLVKCRAWGGNVLANCGPRPTGEMPDCYYACMKEVEEWMETHRESVIGVDAGPYPQRANVPVTVRGKIWYLHLLPAVANGKEDPAVLKDKKPVTLHGVSEPRRVTLLGTQASLDYQFEDDTLSIEVPDSLRTTLVDVLKVEW